MARVYQKQGNTEEAQNLYKVAAEKCPNDMDALINLGDNYLSQGDYRNAQAIYQKAYSIDPENQTVMVALDQLSRRMATPELDLSALLKQANEAPTAKTFITLASLYQQRGDWNEARYWLQEATNLEPYNPDAWFELGNYHRTLAHWGSALKAYSTALQYEPNSFRILMAIGAIQMETGLEDVALKSYQRAIEVEPGKIDGYEALATLLYDLGQTDQAIEAIKAGISHDPGNYRGYQILGDIYTYQGNITQATETYQDGLTVMPGAAELYVSRGVPQTNRVLEARGELKIAEAVELLAKYQVERLEERKTTAVSRRQKRASELKLRDAMEDFVTYENKLEAAQRSLSQTDALYKAAEANYQKALELQPNNEFAWLGLGKLQLVSGTPEEALVYFEKAVEANPNSILALGFLGNAYFDLNRIDDSIKTFQRVLVLDPNNLLAHLGMSKAYRNLDSLEIQQAATLIEHSQYRLDALATYFRGFEAGISGTPQQTAAKLERIKSKRRAKVEALQPPPR